MFNILIVDDESDIVDINSFYIEEYFLLEHKIIHAVNGQSAIEVLSNQDIDVCICDQNMPNGSGDEVCHFISSKKLKAKFVLCSSAIPSDFPTLFNDKNVYSNIVKPDIETGIKKLFEKLVSDEICAIELDSSAERFIPISINLLLLLSKMPCDIFICLTEKKCIKCFSKGDIFSVEDKEKFSKKEIYYLFARHGDEDLTLMKFISDILKKMVKSSETLSEQKILDIHSQVSTMLKKYGISEEYCDIAKDSIQNTVKSILNDKDSEFILRRLNLMGEYPSKLYVMQSTICGIMTRKISWCSEPALNKIITVAFFQDITLDSVKLMKIYDYADFKRWNDSFTENEKQHYLNHPIRSKELISKLKNLPADIDKIFLEQHEMPSGDGFPRNLTAKNISPLSALFILTSIISKRILEDRKIEEISSFFDQLEKAGYKNGNFKDVFDNLKKLLKVE